MKLITSIDNIADIDYTKFIATMRYDEVILYKYQQKQPYSLTIQIDYNHDELAVEFSGKVLMENYCKLINSTTIGTCIDNINKLDICKLNKEAVISNSIVVKCDVTKDVKADIDSVSSMIRQNIANYSKWNTKPYYKGLVIENVVSTPRYKKRLAIYDKSKELARGNSEKFVRSLSNAQYVSDYFKDKVRFELNLNTMYQIRQFLNIPDNRLQSVLNSQANPILTVVDEAVKYTHHRKMPMKLRDYERELLIKECGYDLAKVEAKVRALSSRNTSIQRIMTPYRELLKQINPSNDTSLDIRELVA